MISAWGFASATPVVRGPREPPARTSTSACVRACVQPRTTCQSKSVRATPRPQGWLRGDPIRTNIMGACVSSIRGPRRATHSFFVGESSEQRRRDNWRSCGGRWNVAFDPSREVPPPLCSGSGCEITCTYAAVSSLYLILCIGVGALWVPQDRLRLNRTEGKEERGCPGAGSHSEATPTALAGVPQ